MRSSQPFWRRLALRSGRAPVSMRWQARLWAAALLLVVVGAAGVRLFRLDAEPFWLDEACTYDFNAGTLADVVRSYARDVHPPFYGILLHVWSRVVGESDQALRGYSTAFSLLGLLGVVALVREITGDRWAAIAAGAVIAVNPLDIWHARDARMYEQAACISTIAAYVLCRWLERGEAAPSSRRHAVAYGFLALALLYTHYLASVLLAVQSLVVLVLMARQRRWRDATYLVTAAGMALLLFAPWAVYVLRLRAGVANVVAQVGWIPRPTAATVFSFLTHEFFLGFGSAPGTAAVWLPVAAGGLLATAVAACLSVEAPLSPWSARRSGEGLALMSSLALGPALLAATISRVWRPVYYPPRFALFCLPPAVVALFVMMAGVRPPLRTATIAAIAALMASGAAWQAASSTKVGLPEVKTLGESFGEPNYALFLPPPHGLLMRYELPQSRLQLSREELQRRQHEGKPSVVWVGLKDDTLPPPGSADGKLLAWLANAGPYRRLGHADGFTVYELRVGAPRDVRTPLSSPRGRR